MQKLIMVSIYLSLIFSDEQSAGKLGMSNRLARVEQQVKCATNFCSIIYQWSLVAVFVVVCFFPVIHSVEGFYLS